MARKKVYVQYPLIHEVRRYKNSAGVRFMLADEQRGKDTRIVTIRRPGIKAAVWSGVAGSFAEAIAACEGVTA